MTKKQDYKESPEPHYYQGKLYGVYETLTYIDTAISLISKLTPSTVTIGTIYNQAEPQSRDAFNVLKNACDRLGFRLVHQSVTNSSE